VSGVTLTGSWNRGFQHADDDGVANVELNQPDEDKLTSSQDTA
jgi:hypothetical protein